tara:strand:- start:489 stop:668 length:180 start_codon:yes stop_codon:yes gene_type:complete
MVTFHETKYIRFDQFDKAVQFAEHMSKKYNSVSQIINYDTNELVYAVDPKIDLDKKLRI